MGEGHVGEEGLRMRSQADGRLLDLVAVLRRLDGSRSREPVDVPAQVFDAVIADRDTEVLRRDVFELVGFVDDRRAAGRDDLAVGVLPRAAASG
jgi:hypothetical protein